jgi:hypothetical protein
MSDKPKQYGEEAGQRIDMSQERECHYWSEALGISPDQLKDAVGKVGPMVRNIRRLLRSQIKKSKSA